MQKKQGGGVNSRCKRNSKKIKGGADLSLWPKIWPNHVDPNRFMLSRKKKTKSVLFFFSNKETKTQNVAVKEGNTDEMEKNKTGDRRALTATINGDR